MQPDWRSALQDKLREEYRLESIESIQSDFNLSSLAKRTHEGFCYMVVQERHHVFNTIEWMEEDEKRYNNPNYCRAKLSPNNHGSVLGGEMSYMLFKDLDLARTFADGVRGDHTVGVLEIDVSKNSVVQLKPVTPS